MIQPTVNADLRVALVHDWLTGMRGGERVLETLCRMFPDAPIYTLIYNPKAVSELIRSRQVNVSLLQRIPGIHQSYRWFLPFMPMAIESLKPRSVDLIISTSHCVAKGIIPQDSAKHLCYCFTPMRYAWVFYEEYFGGNKLKSFALKPILQQLRQWDARTCKRVDRFVTLSRHVRRRIQDFYGREADVVYPPVNTDYWTPSSKKHDNYDLIVSALVPYKRLDLAVKTYAVSGLPLKIAGAGSEYRFLRELAGNCKNIEFLGRVSDEEVRELYRSCRALVFPGEEDFGLVPVEVQACGRPVIAYAKGGALETVVEGVTGVFFKEQTLSSFQAAVKRCAEIDWDSTVIRQHAERFSEKYFVAGLRDSLQKMLSAGTDKKK